MIGTVGEIPIFLGAVYGGLVIGLIFVAFRALHALFGGGPISDALLGIAAGIFAVLHSIDPLLCALAEKLQNLHSKNPKKRL